MYGTDLDSTTNDLLLSYDDNFNENYNKIVSLNSTIMNKEELIRLENDIISKKNINIIILQYLILVIVLFGILAILYGCNYITLKTFIILSIIIIIAFTIISVYKAYNNTFVRNLSIEMDEYIKTGLAEIGVQPYKCPSSCTQNDDNIPDPNMININQSPTLNIDPQNNVWQYGDIPSGGYANNNNPAIQSFYTQPTNINNYADEENQPSSNFGTSYPSTTYYQCEWLGGQNNSGLPFNEKSTYTTIPCSYRSNYQEVGRYICQQDPNKTSPNSNVNGIKNCNVITNI